MVKKVKISHAEFVKTWMASDSIATILTATSMSKQAIQARAAKLRKAGVNLPRFQRLGEPIDVDALNALIGPVEVPKKRRRKTK